MLSIFKRKYLDIKKFYFRSGSVFKRFFVVYEIDFELNRLMRYKEINGEKNVEESIYFDNVTGQSLKRDIFHTNYYLFEKNYFNRRIKDGHQWFLTVHYRNNVISSYGSNKYPNEYQSIVSFVENLDLFF